ncbi:MAG: HIT domain-containing protein, partial [Bacillota bacterium]
MEDCLFCKIVSGEMDTDFVYEDEQVVVFEDVNPQAPVHLLIVPKKHIGTVLDLEGEDYELIGHIYKVANHLA